MLELGTQAPSFTAMTHQGNRVALEDYRGRYVLLWFYPIAATPG